jgi:hypothetical protein
MHTPLSSHTRPAHNVLRGAAYILFLIPVIAYVVCALQRMGSPIQLEWMEGGSLQMMHRAISGKPLYAPPSVEFVPYTYTPLYFYLSAFVSFFVGADFFPLRLVSFTASLAAFLFLFAIIRRETGSAIAGVAAAGLFAGSYAVNGNWFDIARIDSLCVAFLLCGMWFALGRGRVFELCVGGLLVALAFFTKQVALVVAGPLILAIIVRHGARGLLFACTTLLAIGVGCVTMEALHDGWFMFYVIESPRARWQSNLSLPHLTRAVFVEFVPVFMLPLALSIAPTWNLVTRPTRAGASFLIVIIGLFLAAAWGRVESINFLNSSIPAHLGMALLFGVALGRISSFVGGALFVGAFTLQLCIFKIMLGPLVPHERELANYRSYTTVVTALPKPTYVPDQGYLTSLGSEGSFAHSIGIMDLMMGGSPSIVARFRQEMEAALDAKRFGAIVCDTELFPNWFKEALERNYGVDTSRNSQGASTPVLGFQHRPLLYIRRTDIS